MTYRSQILIRFAYCDPAGIVFYPRYLEMFNNLVEEWCRAVGAPFFEVKDGRGRGMPTVHLEVDFKAPSVSGDVLQAALTVQAIGGSSLTLRIVLAGLDGATRVQGVVVLALMDVESKRSMQWPDDVRGRITAYRDAPETV